MDKNCSRNFNYNLVLLVNIQKNPMSSQWDSHNNYNSKQFICERDA